MIGWLIDLALKALRFFLKAPPPTPSAEAQAAKADGAATQAATDTQAALASSQRELQAAVNTPSDLADTIEAAKEGNF